MQSELIWWSRRLVFGVVLAFQISSLQAQTSLSIIFGSPHYDLALGQTYFMPVSIEPLPASGLFSYGINVSLLSTTPAASNVVDVILPSALSHNGVRSNDVIRAFGLGGAAVKGTVDFFADPMPVYRQPLLATFVLSNLPAGTYTAQASLYQTLGTNEAVFVDGQGAVLDSFITFASAVVNVLSEWQEIAPVDMNSPDWQTGLFLATYRLRNTSAATWNAVRIIVENLPNGVVLYNRHGTTNGNPFVQFNAPLAPGQLVDLKLEYYVPDRRTRPNPTFQVEQATPPTPPSAGQVVTVLGPAQLDDGSLLIAFPSVAAVTYFVQYADNVNGPWNTAFPPVTGNGDYVQWVDNGPPKTESYPTNSAQRYYRVLAP